MFPFILVINVFQNIPAVCLMLNSESLSRPLLKLSFWFSLCYLLPECWMNIKGYFMRPIYKSVLFSPSQKDAELRGSNTPGSNQWTIIFDDNWLLMMQVYNKTQARMSTCMVFTDDPLAPDWTISWRLLSGNEVWRPTGMHTCDRYLSLQYKHLLANVNSLWL